MKRMACAVAFAAGTGLTGVSALPAIAAPTPVTAASGLQVNIAPPGTVSGDAPISLDLKFHGGNIRIVELFVDGARLTKQALSTRDGRGVVHFSLDPSLLTQGDHEILVKAYEADGTCATTTTQIKVVSGDANALARLEWPKRNAEVQGIVPINIKIDSSIMDPYVTYTVDNDFLAFRNYAPYIYNWDTSKAGNGIHTIGIEVMDGRTLQVVQKLTLPVVVKNVGGFTNIQRPTGNPGRIENGSAIETIMGAAESAMPESALISHDNILGLARVHAHSVLPSLRHNAMPTGFHSNSPLRNSGKLVQSGVPILNGHAPVALPLDPSAFVVRNTPVHESGHTPKSTWTAISAPNVNRPTSNSPGSVHVAPGLAALAPNPHDLMLEPALARQSIHVRQSGGVALRPSTERRFVRGGAAPAGVRPVGGNRKTFDVAFNNKVINFDVPPRVENGLPLAPFRAIFEHTGGVVKWFNDAKVVRATDSQHEIEIKIGSREATVNNQALLMDTIPYLDHGRTIVPLSFMSRAMDLKVTFDQESGHLLIEKK